MSGARALTGLAALIAASQQEDADASVASLAKRGLRVVREPTHLDGSLFSVRSANGDEVAHAEMGPDPNGGLFARYMEVEPEHRGSGLMNEIYDAVEEITEQRINPSNWLTNDGAKFWARRNRELLERLYNEGMYDWDDGYDDDVVGKALRDSLLGPVK